jgi:hypothetical protein
VIEGEVKSNGRGKKGSSLLFLSHNKPTKEGPLSFVLFDSPFTSVSTGSRGHPSIIFLFPALANILIDR